MTPPNMPRKGAIMAVEPTSNSDSPVDFNRAKEDYSLLIAMLKWGAVIALIIGFIVMILLAS
jgi:maltodextrin utilization protein YvdJ